MSFQRSPSASSRRANSLPSWSSHSPSTESEAASSVYLPPPASASDCKAGRSSRAMTTLPDRSLTNPPPLGIGAPSAVPAASTEVSMPRSLSCRAFAASLDAAESVTSRISPRLRPDRSSREAAMSSARSARLPATGMISGRRAGNRLAIVFMSLVRGETM